MLRASMVDLMGVLTHAIAMSRSAAEDCTRAADSLGENSGAAALRSLARWHRVEVLKLQGQLAGLRHDYMRRFGVG